MKMIAPFAMSMVLLIAATPASAQDRVAVDAKPIVTDMGAAPIDDTVLGSIAGREDTRQTSLANQTAGVTSNSVGDNVTTGGAQISGNAFQNMSGLSILNINTGNNVAINAAMNVNIAINPAP